MSEKQMLQRQLMSYAFAKHELVLFLDTHPHDRKAMSLLKEFRHRYAETLAKYEARYGTYVVTTCDVEPEKYWNWLDSPWPWEKED